MKQCVWIAVAVALASVATANASPHFIDLAGVSTDIGALTRAYGYTGTGSRGLPVTGGLDTDADGSNDYAFATLTASPLGRAGAGEVYLVFGNGSIGGTVDTGVVQPDVLRFAGDVVNEAAGSAIWMDDVTGDGVGDLLIARENHTFAGRTGCGALTIVVGGPALRTFAATLQTVDLQSPPAALTLTTLVGASSLDRLGIWVRTGDVTGDGTADIVVGADQTTELAESHRGAVYVIRGGAHLAANQTVDLANFATTALPGHIARLTPPLGSAHHHFGATVQIADLDGNGRGEVMAAATLNRAGAAIVPFGANPVQVHSSGGATDGTLYIAWDDNFTGVWPTGFTFVVDAGPGSQTTINGADCNANFGEEILGGLDYDANGNPELFVGDLTANCGPVSRSLAGSGHVFFDAAALKGLSFDLQSPPVLTRTDLFGAAAVHISSDTAFQGDFDGDGFDDLGITSPLASPFGRTSAGAFHVVFGQSSGFPAAIDLANLPASSVVRITQVDGAHGAATGDSGDTLGYSAASGDIDGDGNPDVITNEMVGNGVLPAAVDAGNLLILDGPFVAGITPLASMRWGGWGALAGALLAVGAVARRRAFRP